MLLGRFDPIQHCLPGRGGPEAQLDGKSGPTSEKIKVQVEGLDPAQNDSVSLEVERRSGLGEFPGRERKEERAMKGRDPFGERGEEARGSRRRQAKKRVRERVREREIRERDCGGGGGGSEESSESLVVFY